MSVDLDKQFEVVKIIQTFTGTLSFLGSSIIISIILRSKTKLNSSYRRLIFGMSVSDLSSSCVQALSCIPTNSVLACNLQAFFLHIGTLNTQMYNASLCIYYVLTICFDKKDPWIRKKVEPFLHSISTFWNVGTGIFFMVSKNFNQAGANCWIAPAPRDCFLDPDIECERGVNAIKLRWWFSAYQMIAIFLIIIVSMGMLICKVKRQENVMNRRFSVLPRQLQSQESKRNFASILTNNINVSQRTITRQPSESNGRKRQMVKQAFVYVIAYFLPFFFPIIFQITLVKKGKRNFIVWILVAIFMPLQGFFNCVVFIRPRILSYKKSNPDSSWTGAFLSTINAPSRLNRTSKKSSDMENV